jgi:hypothetical protein
MTQIYGKKDSGKSSMLMQAIVECQKQNILPILILTEFKFDSVGPACWNYNLMTTIQSGEFLQSGELFSFGIVLLFEGFQCTLVNDLFVVR